MLEAHHYTVAAERKGSYQLPQEFDGTVNRSVLYQAVRAFRNGQRQGTASTKTRSEVSGGGRKPWRQKGTGRARHGTIRSPLWVGGGVVFGPKPRSYRTKLPRKVRRFARQSALNARANDGAIHVIEALTFERPRTRQMVELLDKLGLADRKVLVLTADTRPEVYLSCGNLRRVRVMRYVDASAYHVLWADALVVEEGAIGGQAVAATRRSATGRVKRAKKASETAARVKKAKTAETKVAKVSKQSTTSSKKGDSDA